MKNIHVLPTSQPSRLIIQNSNKLILGQEDYSIIENRQNIYITSDEEIKEGDWYLNTEEKNSVMNPLYGKLYIANQSIKEVSYDYIHNLKKIILTTDKDLIKEGIQPIDDEFLEWFVKNPSCEYVEVSEDYFKPSNMVYGHDTEPYKIIIPKEEQKQHLIDMIRNDEELGLYDEPKQICECIDECLGYLTKECKRIEEINKLDEIIKK